MNRLADLNSEQELTFTCPSCGKSRKVTVNRLAAAYMDRRCDDCADSEEKEAVVRDRKNQTILRVNRSGLPPALRRKRLEPGPHRDLASEWARSESMMLTVHGPVGAGKTHFAAVACRYMLSVRQVSWVEVARQMAMLQAAFGDDDRRDALAAFTGTGPVVFDDFDKVIEGERGLPKLFAALDARVSRDMPVLVTMNSDLNDLRDRLEKQRPDLAEPIVSRLRGGRVLKLAGRDRRRA